MVLFCFSFQGRFLFYSGPPCGARIGYAGLLSLNVDSCAIVSGPTSGRRDRASGWDGFALVFLSWKVFVLLPDLPAVPVSDMRVSFL
jgi:hypothetical protein